MNTTCVHSCKGLCTALNAAELREQEAIRTLRDYAGQCDYPDVRELLEQLCGEHERGLRLLREKREELTVRFAMIDDISESYL
jgi:rubrerythrin